MPYQSPYTATLADLMFAGQRAKMRAAQQAQQAEAEAQMGGAEAWGGFAQNQTGLLNMLLNYYAMNQPQPQPFERVAVPAEERARPITGPVPGLELTPAPTYDPVYEQGGIQQKYRPR